MGHTPAELLGLVTLGEHFGADSCRQEPDLISEVMDAPRPELEGELRLWVCQLRYSLLIHRRTEPGSWSDDETQRVEYTALIYRGLGQGRAWFEDGERAGQWEELSSILNRYAGRGWKVLATGGGSDSPFIILERPFEGHALVPADAPAGRGDEPAPSEERG